MLCLFVLLMICLFVLLMFLCLFSYIFNYSCRLYATLLCTFILFINNIMKLIFFSKYLSSYNESSLVQPAVAFLACIDQVIVMSCF